MIKSNPRTTVGIASNSLLHAVSGTVNSLIARRDGSSQELMTLKSKTGEISPEIDLNNAGASFSRIYSAPTNGAKFGSSLITTGGYLR